MIQLFDTLTFDKQPKLTKDGYLVADVRAGRTGIQLYSGAEVELPDREFVRVYRPPEEVFKDETMQSFTNIPVTQDHPPEAVSSINWKKYAVGFTGETCARDGGFVRVPLAIKDADAISAVVKDRKRELSLGYMCDIELKSGRTPDGEEYDAIQRSIRGNHLAIVSAGRAGRECRIGDKLEDREMAELRKMVVDGITFPVTDEAETFIKKLQGDLAKLTTDNLSLQAQHKAELETKDAEIAKREKLLGEKDGELAKLKNDALTPAAIDKLVAERAEVTGKAKLIADVDFTGKSIADIRRIAVAKAQGEVAVKDKSDDFVWGLFENLTSSASSGVAGGVDPVAAAFRVSDASASPANSAKARNDAHEEYKKYLQDGYKEPIHGGYSNGKQGVH